MCAGIWGVVGENCRENEAFRVWWQVPVTGGIPDEDDKASPLWVRLGTIDRQRGTEVLVVRHMDRIQWWWTSGNPDSTPLLVWPY